MTHAGERNRPEGRPLQEEQEVTERLSKAAGSLDSPAEVHGALKEIFRALVAGQLSRERAGTLGFLAQMLLRSHREIAYYEKAQLALRAQEEGEQSYRGFPGMFAENSFPSAVRDRAIAGAEAAAREVLAKAEACRKRDGEKEEQRRINGGEMKH